MTVVCAGMTVVCAGMTVGYVQSAATWAQSMPMNQTEPPAIFPRFRSVFEAYKPQQNLNA